VEDLLTELESVDLPPFYTDRLKSRLRAASRPSWTERLKSPRLAWTVAGVCAIALLLVVVGTNGDAPTPGSRATVHLAPNSALAQAAIDPVTPAGDSVVSASDVEIIAAIYPPIESGIVRLYVDEADVTGLAEVSDSYVMYSPADKLAEGEHIVTIEIQDESGRRLKDFSWLFYTMNGKGRPEDGTI
jgi:hypothetical protein